jgi:uncharacterized protein (DUF983 family)
MIAVDCPRCGRTWYSDEHHAGRVRLCSDCADELRTKRRRNLLQWDAFAFTAAGMLLLDVVLIVLAAVWPRVFGWFLLGYGLVLLAVGIVGFRAVASAHWSDVDWEVARWPALIGAMGLACATAYASLVLPAL